jgi:hypothetical protein
MVQKTDLNVSPYYDDYDETDNFHRTLFRPGFAIQARELTQLQSTLQNQIEKHGSHIFKEGAVVIPGNVHINTKYHSLKLASTFASETINPSQYFSSTTPVTITGATSGVSAVVIGFDVATTTDQPTLYLRYVNSGTDNVTNVFADGENISSDAGVTHTTAYSSNVASATTFTSQFSAAAGSTATNLASSSGPASRRGSAFHVETGVYYIRGFFVTCSEETLVLDKYDNTPSYRIGFTTTESLVTPETDTSLLDNSTGSSNFAAKGAHRLKIALALGKLDRGSTADSSFVELMDVKNGVVQHYTRQTEYSVLEETFARRTFDESGDYTVRPFQFIAKESVDITVGNEDFTGLYSSGASTDDGNTASNALLALQISPGKAYIKGNEIEKMAPTIKDINKARDFNTVNAGVSTFNVGNFANITNLYGTPDVTFISGESTAFKQLEIYDDKIATRGTANGNLVGVARARTIEYNTGTAGDTTAVYKLFMFDIQAFTKLTLSGTPSPTLLATHANGGVQIKGNTSGATGFVFASGTSNTTANLTNVVGTFSVGEKLIASDSALTGGLIEVAGGDGSTDITISEVVSFKFEDARSVRMADDDSGQDFTADFVLETAAGEGGDTLLQTGTGESDGSAVQLETGTDEGLSVISLESISVARLKDTQKNRAMFKLSKKVIKTLLTATNSGTTDTQYTVRRQFTGTTNSSGVVTFNAGSNETFLAFAEKDYTMSILTAGGGTGAQGDIVSVSGKTAGTGSGTLTITDSTILGNAAKVKLTTSILKTSVIQKTKTTNLMKQLKVLHTDADGSFGIRSTDKTISLGRADVFNLVGVFDSESTSADAAAPTLTVTSAEGTFTRGETITGSTSGAKGRIISTTSPFSYVAKTGVFSVSETITGASSGATGTVSATTLGSDVITSRYELDTGQRDNYYDISRIVRKPGRATPTGRVLVIYDYFEHGTGDVMTVDSYSDVADQMDYEDIPTYTATKVDPDAPKPSGEFPLTDTFDFRPRVEDITGTSSTLETVDQVTGNSFNFFSRQYDGTGSSTVDVCKPGSFIQSDFEFYLPKRVIVSMAKSGEIIVNEGVGAEEPNLPKAPDDTMKLCSLFLPAFTFRPKDVEIKRDKNQRFTMRDIAELERRVDNVEYYTALNMLERDAESFEVTDSNGLNRFKAGFIVDNFSGHRVGDTQHKDYKCSIDMQKGQLRPVHKTKPISLEESVSTTAARTTAGYQKTGDLITLPYTEETFTSQPFASRVEKVTPLLSHEWVGKITLSPDADEWFETEIAPELIVNVEGNFDAVTNAAQNQLGTVWNSWETQWSGSTRSEQRNGDTVRTILSTREQQRRTGIRTEVVEQIDRESQGLRVINRAVIPIVRSRSVAFDGVDFRPNTRLYVFFDKINVDAHVTPSSGFSSASTIIAGSPLVTSASGRVAGTFLIPDPTAEGSPQFQTGDIQFRLTSSSKNLTGTDASVDTNSTADATTDTLSTAGDAIYSSRGILETFQETIIATRNARVAQTSVNQTQALTSSTVIATRQENQDDGGGEGGGSANDPLAQTFIVQGENSTDGRFITSVDLFFSDKDSVAPVTVEIRNVINGYPGVKILPFGRVSLDPSSVNTSETAATATTFTFSSPVFVKPETEYAIAILTVSPEYKVWTSRMGENDIGGSRIISAQPHTGILFKSSNNSTWEPSQLEDLKFNLKTAKFNRETPGTLTLVNEALPAKKLAVNPILMTGNSTTLQIKHRDHHMHSTSNNVTISNVSTGITTTLNGAITAAATSLTLTSGTNFDDTSGKFSKTAANEFHIKIGDEIMKYTTISGTAVSSLSRGEQGTTAAAHADGATVELFMIHKVPLFEINKTHTAIANINMDSYTITLSTTPVITGNATAEFGGSSVTATENSIMDTMKTIIGSLELPNTSIVSTLRPTTATSASGTQTSFSTVSATNAFSFPLNENFEFDAPHMACSSINETNELSGLKSCFVDLNLSTTSSTVSPVIDLQRTTLLSVANRLDNIDSSSDVFPTTDFFASTEPDGDNNAAIYLTKQVALENPASAIKVLFNAHRPSTSDIKVMFKILRTDDSTDFDDLGYTFFNTTGVDDNVQAASADENDFRDYIYTAGVTDDGIGTPLDEFISLQIKIVMQGTNSATPPRIKELRAIALVT